MVLLFSGCLNVKNKFAACKPVSKYLWHLNYACSWLVKLRMLPNVSGSKSPFSRYILMLCVSKLFGVKNRNSRTFLTVVTTDPNLKKNVLLAYFLFLSLGFIKIHDQDICSVLDIYLYRIWTSTLMREGSVFLRRCYICCTIVSARVYLR
jgi:hypothetical protein